MLETIGVLVAVIVGCLAILAQGRRTRKDLTDTVHKVEANLSDRIEKVETRIDRMEDRLSSEIRSTNNRIDSLYERALRVADQDRQLVAV